MDINLILSVIAIVWLTILTILIVWAYFVLKNLVKNSKDKDFIKTFKNIQDIQSDNSIGIKELNLRLEQLKDESKLHIQKVGLVKFNPFNETGGDHSFSLALLDGNKNGIIITSLHTRERTRFYLKEVFLGKTKLDLSKEESNALKIALK
ncbi:hypothetical protein A2422_03185 [Candidatus Woesebacteria bacterium RIFOXYC1_FULL_31_51]|uniref:DUF4446 domain-containing protein n=1 Tax=Candidatus Woesebacteria bacterium GW2011_GWC2_31_9 TaxID=1618586 RepID=A0A0F9YLQ1_9BACT|nr:MAG: hypothetical protein UR17_C0001G0143 [Candidatus Woesebacteria bacterium GW2011_GWF1_31_35]KKP23362.1 MAG: hypothetical protein UR11_C0001G0336 [Candidatus Woesebacteria bacterium GW2011_GWC1_30_29]KKP26122.1 MAG: hypothetical protein UR13_C0005G0005 [Candidatus Woesebacteria bacterium GW2011_GWD1_31_12]KKP27621.1 MAG: hypothetical protein UR16_C0003G0281 [Candidatus Woesebacteria bacterium GW2011_GWB1_31_29]KKP32138.1 MAG: hypothetical protein UR21_C0002G0057 [Candidatus Woesebacteria 